MGKHLFVTVGTTEFEKLIEAVTTNEVLQKLRDKGFTSIEIQTGTGKEVDKKFTGIKINSTPFFDDFINEIKKADLVISHAGAGSCIDVLRTGKPLVAIVNEDLMDNHQTELAQELKKEGYLNYGTCSTLLNILDEDLATKKLPEVDATLFGRYVDKLMGF